MTAQKERQSPAGRAGGEAAEADEATEDTKAAATEEAVQLSHAEQEALRRRLREKFH